MTLLSSPFPPFKNQISILKKFKLALANSFRSLDSSQGYHKSVESNQEDGIQFDSPTKNFQFPSKLLARWRLTILSVFISAVFLFVFTCKSNLSSLKSLYSSNHLNRPPSLMPPVLIHFKTNSHNHEVIKCDTPFTLLQDDTQAQVVIWPNPGVELSSYDGELARKKKPWQLNAFWSLENGQYYPALDHARERLRSRHPKAFDLEITYRTTSDFPIPYAYPFIDFKTPPLPFAQRRQDKIAAAFVSNCSPQNNRTDILKHLMELLPGQIDSFGACLSNANIENFFDQFNITSNSEQRLTRWEEKMRVIERYKFTIAFENAGEEDYVTEKFYQALAAGSPPIHLGLSSRDLDKFKPSSNSVLNVADFPTVEALAEKLKELANDQTQYEKMLSWKNAPLSGQFSEIVGMAKTHELCRIAQFVRGRWKNPYAWKPERYLSFYDRLNHVSQNNQTF